MITYIKGQITEKSPTYLVVEANSIGYHIHISLNTYSYYEDKTEVKVLTWLQVREDAHVLFGFSTEAERSIFLLLLSVSGVGTNTARLLLSGMNVEELKAAIIQEDVVTFSKVKGIGPKTAKRIIVELKDKVIKDSGEHAGNLLSNPQDNTTRDEALSALVALGFNRIVVQKALTAILKEDASIKNVEDLIKKALRHLS